MIIKDKKYSILATFGISIYLIYLVLAIFLDQLLIIQIRFLMLGFIFGWLTATYLLRYLILKDEHAKEKSKSDELFSNIKNTIDTHKTKI